MSTVPITFFQRDPLEVAPELMGKLLCRRFEDGQIERYRITEIEAYCGETDKACHAHKGRTKRTEIMYHQGGHIYMYLIYGMYWMLNFVTENEGTPSAILIRGVENISGPGKVGKALQLDKSFYGKLLQPEDNLWLEDDGYHLPFQTTPRIGINYAGAPWINKPWRFEAK
ncbi:DNA-3-methyladenine glycosylase [Prolixibacteraceae bacterium JC049]|nr:DNA-3-methyladenine glycosylase [Prolixibacteraceae bacterium JC049]